MSEIKSSLSKVVICMYDIDVDDPFNCIVNKNQIKKWNDGRFIDLNSHLKTGLETSLYPSRLGRDRLVVNGIYKTTDNCKYNGAKRKNSDSSFYPLFKEGSYIYKNNEYLLQSNRTANEPVSLSTTVDSSEALYRHQLLYTVDKSNELKATVFKRELGKVDTPYKEYQYVNQFTVYPSYDYNIYTKGPYINWNVVDDTIDEFMVDNFQSEGKELVFNKPLNTWFEGPHFTDVNEHFLALKKLISTAEPNIFYTEYYSVKELTLYVYNGLSLDEWTRVTLSEFNQLQMGEKKYFLDEAYGIIYTNPFAGLSSNEEFLVSYYVIPLVQYRLPYKDSNYIATETNLDRVVTNLDKGSFIYVLKDTEIYKYIQLSISSTVSFSKNKFTNISYGDSVVKFTVKCTDKRTNKPVSSIKVKLKKNLMAPSGGRFLGYSDSTVYVTDDNGEINLYYKPNPLGDGIGSNDFVKLDNYTLVNSNTFPHTFVNSDDVYLYGIYKDDQLIPYNPETLTGRKILFGIYDSKAINDYDGSLGAFMPMHPSLMTEDAITFPMSLPDFNRYTTNSLASYFIAGPREDSYTLSLLIDNDMYQKVNNDLPFSIIVGFKKQSKGEYIDLYNRIHPVGWRLPDDILDSNSQLGGSLFVSLNPIAGAYNIISPVSNNEETTNPSSELNIKFTYTTN